MCKRVFVLMVWTIAAMNCCLLRAQTDIDAKSKELNSSGRNQHVFDILAHPDWYSPKAITVARGYVESQIMEIQSEMNLNERLTNVLNEELQRNSHEARSLNKRFIEAGTTDAAALLSSLSSQRIQVEIELAGLKSRREALLGYENQTKREFDEVEKNDPILRQLMEIMAHIERQMDFAQKLSEKNMASESEVANVRAKIAEARIRVEQRREELRERNAGGADVKHQLMELGLGINENQAKLTAIQSSIDSLREVAENQVQRDLLIDLKIPALQQQVVEAEIERTVLRNSYSRLMDMKSMLDGAISKGEAANDAKQPDKDPDSDND